MSISEALIFTGILCFTWSISLAILLAITCLWDKWQDARLQKKYDRTRKKFDFATRRSELDRMANPPIKVDP